MPEDLEKTLATRIAARLYNEGITIENYNLDDALAVMDNTVAPRLMKAVLIHNQDEIQRKLLFFTESEHE